MHQLSTYSQQPVCLCHSAFLLTSLPSFLCPQQLGSSVESTCRPSQTLSGYHFPKQSCWLEHAAAQRIKAVSGMLIIGSSSRLWNHSLFPRKYFPSSSRRFPDNVRFMDMSASAREPQRHQYSSAFDSYAPSSLILPLFSQSRYKTRSLKCSTVGFGTRCMRDQFLCRNTFQVEATTLPVKVTRTSGVINRSLTKGL